MSDTIYQGPVGSRGSRREGKGQGLGQTGLGTPQKKHITHLRACSQGTERLFPTRVSFSLWRKVPRVLGTWIESLRGFWNLPRCHGDTTTLGKKEKEKAASWARAIAQQ